MPTYIFVVLLRDRLVVKLLIELYDKGLLCHCEDKEHCWYEEDNIILETWHYEDCEAKFKMMGALSEDSGSN